MQIQETIKISQSSPLLAALLGSTPLQWSKTETVVGEFEEAAAKFLIGSGRDIKAAITVQSTQTGNVVTTTYAGVLTLPGGKTLSRQLPTGTSTGLVGEAFLEAFSTAQTLEADVDVTEVIAGPPPVAVTAAPVAAADAPSGLEPIEPGSSTDPTA